MIVGNDMNLFDLVKITDSAQVFLADLLENQEEPMNIKLEVANPGSAKAETMLSYQPKGEPFPVDTTQGFKSFNLLVGKGSAKFLEDTVIDYDTDKFGGSLTIRSPKSKLPQMSEDSSLEEKVNYILQTDVNPMLASHGGHVDLVEIDENKRVVVQFGGGCQGCQGVDFTMMSMVDNNIREKFPEITSVIDVTDHSYTANAYY
jgi:Fe/S biogenesis protein NfuA|tara:strand:+ start:1258 stop:1866 length:609 start_codon:yes stop_codon:yes gene_type:complete